MNKYTQKDISKMLSHINSVPRQSLNFLTPYDMAHLILGSSNLKALNIQKIPPDDIILNPKLLIK